MALFFCFFFFSELLLFFLSDPPGLMPFFVLLLLPLVMGYFQSLLDLFLRQNRPPSSGEFQVIDDLLLEPFDLLLLLQRCLLTGYPGILLDLPHLVLYFFCCW